ncbi:MTP-1 family protein [Paenibacillus senegalensis]|uniref:MTP-1 family protein n=1 Tax=Paenibacillus senegalensis TaxID=1465766 RepID=UPI00028866F3|nr:DUF1861 family protein [Paenibacillus senegalensis]
MDKLVNRGWLSCNDLLEAFRSKEARPYGAQKLLFSGVGTRDVYNIAAPFEDEGEMVLAGRVEDRDSEQSEIYFFAERGGNWVAREGAPVFRLQDPFFTRISGELVFGGVETFPHPEKAGKLSWRTVLYRGSCVADLKPFFSGPDQMKDLRLVEQQDGTIGVFTRPQGEKGGRGKIGYTQIDRLEDLSQEIINQAPLLEGQFSEEEWGGGNEIHLLTNGFLGVLGHIARFDEHGDRHYYPMIFVFDPATRTYSNLEIIAERGNFVDGPAKRPDLADVVFSGGLVRKADGTADLYAGTSDAEAQKVTISDPFSAFEKKVNK